MFSLAEKEVSRYWITFPASYRKSFCKTVVRFNGMFSWTWYATFEDSEMQKGGSRIRLRRLLMEIQELLRENGVDSLIRQKFRRWIQRMFDDHIALKMPCYHKERFRHAWFKIKLSKWDHKELSLIQILPVWHSNVLLTLQPPDRRWRSVRLDYQWDLLSARFSCSWYPLLYLIPLVLIEQTLVNWVDISRSLALKFRKLLPMHTSRMGKLSASYTPSRTTFKHYLLTQVFLCHSGVTPFSPQPTQGEDYPPPLFLKVKHHMKLCTMKSPIYRTYEDGDANALWPSHQNSIPKLAHSDSKWSSLVTKKVT